MAQKTTNRDIFGPGPGCHLTPTWKICVYTLSGTSSGWTELKDSILNIHDFRRSLLREMDASPELRKDGNVRSLYRHTANLRLIAADANYSCWAFDGRVGHQNGTF